MIRFIILIVCFTIMFTGCIKSNDISAVERNKNSINENYMPSEYYSIDDFSDTKLEKRKHMFSKIESIVLYINNNPIELDISNKNIVQLLNYLSYCIEIDEIKWIQGAVTSEWMDNINEKETKLEITFANDHMPELYDLSGYDKLIISDRWCTCISWVTDSRPNCYEKGKYAVAFSPNFGEFADNAEVSLLKYSKLCD